MRISSNTSSLIIRTDDSSSAINELKAQEVKLKAQLNQINSGKEDEKTKQAKIKVIEAQIEQIEAQIQQKQSNKTVQISRSEQASKDKIQPIRDIDNNSYNSNGAVNDLDNSTIDVYA